MAETPIYSEHDIMRYLQRKMSPQEMHAFEKALMDDPFLADALEGYSASEAALSQQHLAEIEAAIAGNRQKSKIVPLVPPRRTGWKAAAAIVLVAGAALLSYFLLRPAVPEKSLAQLQKNDTANQVAVPPTRPEPAPLNGDSADKIEEGLVATEDKPKLPTRIYRSAPPPATVTAPSIRAESAYAASNFSTRKMTDSVQPYLTVESPQLKRVQDYAPANLPVIREMRGRVIDSAGQPLAQATIIVNHTRQGTISDENGNFLLRVPDTVTRVTVSSPGYNSTTASLSSGIPGSSIVLDKNSQSLSEVVILKEKSTVSADATATAEPVGGWKNFRQYITQRIDSLQAKDSRHYYNNDDIVLEFSIDEQGNPVNIKAEAETNRAAADKAIEILASGPKWKKKKKDKKVKILIPFGSGK